ncbi:MAG: adenosylcobinamide-GDP ribazoletransferase [Candidatus Thiodiazotropha sp.]
MSQAPQSGESGRALLYYPLVGLLIGGMLYGLGELLENQPDHLAAILLLTAWVGITGALHLDGLADSADAWLGGLGDRQRTLEIMQDPRCGSLGVVVIALLLLLKFATLQTLLNQGSLALLMIPPVVGRTALVALLLTTPYVRTEGLGSQLAREQKTNPSRIVIGLTALLITIWLGPSGIVHLSVSVICLLLLRHLMMKRLQGTTGDSAGALLEIIEATLLVSLALAATP